MSDESTQTKKQETQDEEPELPLPWKQIQSAIWLIGLALLAWQGWWWPGILVLVAISGVTQAVLQSIARQNAASAQIAQTTRAAADAVPPNCPTCGAAISAGSVVWTGPAAAQCPYCKSAVPLKNGATPVKE